MTAEHLSYLLIWAEHEFAEMSRGDKRAGLKAHIFPEQGYVCIDLVQHCIIDSSIELSQVIHNVMDEVRLVEEPC